MDRIIWALSRLPYVAFSMLMIYGAAKISSSIEAIGGSAWSDLFHALIMAALGLFGMFKTEKAP
jgi:hypothetical protein